MPGRKRNASNVVYRIELTIWTFSLYSLHTNACKSNELLISRTLGELAPAKIEKAIFVGASGASEIIVTGLHPNLLSVS